MYACLIAVTAFFGVCSSHGEHEQTPVISTSVDIFNVTATSDEVLFETTEITTTEENFVGLRDEQPHHNHYDLMQLPEMSCKSLYKYRKKR